MAETCPQCGSDYVQLANHWSHSSNCDYPNLTDVERDICTGIVMGDGCINRGSSSNPHLQVRMINKEYLEWLDSVFGVYSNGVIHDQTPEESMSDIDNWDESKSTCVENYSDVYIWKTKSTPELDFLSKWYQTGSKKFDYMIDLSPEIFIHWYVCDGTLTKHNQVEITASNELGNEEKIRSMFTDNGLPKPSFSYWSNSDHDKMKIRFTVDQTEDIMQYMCQSEPDIPKGFSYKFPERFK